MTQSPTRHLQPGDAFPTLSVPLVGGPLTLPRSPLGAWSAVLYRDGRAMQRVAHVKPGRTLARLLDGALADMVGAP